MTEAISESKLRVLNVASKLFMQRGYEGVKLKEIADILDIKQPSLYYHFEDGKEQIYVEVVRMELEKINQGLLNAISRNPESIRETLFQIGEWSAKNMEMSPVIMNKVDMPQLSEENQQAIQLLQLEKIFLPIKMMFERAIDKKLIRPVSSNVLTGLTLSVLEVMDDRIKVGPDKLESWRQTVDIILEGLYSR